MAASKSILLLWVSLDSKPALNKTQLFSAIDDVGLNVLACRADSLGTSYDPAICVTGTVKGDRVAKITGDHVSRTEGYKKVY